MLILSASYMSDSHPDAKDVSANSADPVVMEGGGARATALSTHAKFYTRLSGPAQNISIALLYLIADS